MIFSSAGKSYNFNIPAFLPKLIAVLVVLLLCSSVFFGYNFLKLNKKISTVTKLQKENDFLKKKISSFDSRIATLKEKIQHIDSLGTKLRVMARLDTTKSIDEGIGGPSFDEIKNFVSENSLQDENIKKVHYILDKLTFELKQEEKNITELFKYFKAKDIKLSSTPSIWPANGWISSPFGVRRDPFTGRRRFHEGIDITNRIGAPVIAPADGIVTFAKRNGGYGKVIYISHGFGISTRYGHLNKIYVKVGQHVQRGDLIGLIGNTGRSTGPHLHYEVRINNKPVNPINFILN
jgi:murein DD-endopeptidase MepM/ murein hydrolase activator NlpD